MPTGTQALRPWRVKASRRVFEDRWISIRADDCETASGVPVAPYYIVEYPDWVQVVAIDEHDHMLLVRQYRHGLGGVSLEIPAGNMEPGDSHPLTAAARELAEETGYAAERIELVTSFTASAPKFSNRVHVVLALDARPLRLPPPQDADEEIELVRVPCAEALRMALGGDIVEASHIASIVLALERVGRLRVDYREPRHDHSL